VNLLQSLRTHTPGSGRPLLCLEVNPPRGTTLDEVWARLEGAVEGVDFFNVTDCPLARLRLAALPFASLLKHRFGREPLVNLSCRDRNLMALQADLLAGWALGVRSVVALTGDAMSVGDSPDRKGVFEVNSIGLLNCITTLNGGQDLTGNRLNGATDYCPGVVVNPNARNQGAELKRLQRKKDAGACYALSQPVFDEVASVSFFKEAHAIGLPILLGLLPLKSGRAATGLLKIPGIRLSDGLLTRMNEEPERDLSDFSIELCLGLAEMDRPWVSGFHVISGATPKLALRLTKALSGYISGLA